MSKYFYVDFEQNCPFIVLFKIAVLFALLELWFLSGEILFTLILNPLFFYIEFALWLLLLEEIKFPNARPEVFCPSILKSGMKGKFSLLSYITDNNCF